MVVTTDYWKHFGVATTVDKGMTYVFVVFSPASKKPGAIYGVLPLKVRWKAVDKLGRRTEDGNVWLPEKEH